MEVEHAKQLRGLSAALDLLGDVFEWGFTAETRRRIDAAGEPISVPAEASEDEAAARHERVTGFLVPPFAGAFLDLEGRAGGATEEVVATALLRVGFDPAGASLSPEHAAGVCRGISRLLLADTELADGVIESALLSWFPALGHAFQEEGEGAYAEAVALAIEVSLLAHQATRPQREPSVPDRLPPMSDSKTTVRDLSAWLSTYAVTGVHVGRGTLQRWARALEVPRGFGDSRLILGNLMRSAGHYGRMEDLISLMDTHAAGYASSWESWGQRSKALKDWSDFWQDRIARYREALRDMAALLMEAQE